MEGLPDEIWRRILEMGIEKSKLSYKDLCRVSIACRRLNRLSNEDSLWTNLLTLDFPQPIPIPIPIPISSFKTQYRKRFEKDKERKLAAHRRAVLRAESQVAVCFRNLKHLQRQLVDERGRMKAAAQELANLDKARSASVALNVWQPDIVWGQQKQLVEQCALPFESRISAVEMELRLSKQQIEIFSKAYKDEKQRLDAAKKQTDLMKYHPLRDYYSVETGVKCCQNQRKKLKRLSGIDKDCCERVGDLVNQHQVGRWSDDQTSQSDF